MNEEENEEPHVNIKLNDDDKIDSETSEQGGEYEPDITIIDTKDEDQNQQQSSVKGSFIRYELKQS